MLYWPPLNDAGLHVHKSFHAGASVKTSVFFMPDPVMVCVVFQGFCPTCPAVPVGVVPVAVTDAEVVTVGMACDAA